MAREKKIRNAVKRGEVHRKDRREKAQEKLKRRMEIRKAEKAKDGGAELKAARLAKNVPKTLDNTRVYDSSSYLTANPADLQAAAERAAAESRKVNGEPEPAEEGESDEESMEDGSEDDEVDDDEEEGEGSEGDEEEEADDDDDEEMPEAGPSRLPTLIATQPSRKSSDRKAAAEAAAQQAAAAQLASGPPPRILVTTSPSPCKETYEFCDELTKIFPGGEFFKRPKGKGFELGRIARWSAKRGYGAMIVVNEDHKAPNALTLMKLPAGPTAYFKLTSIQSGKSIYGHAKPSPHSPELILNNFSTLLGNSVGRLFGSLFPPLPQFRGRQVVTLHNQRDFLFFRRHRYMFPSATSAKLQEIGPRFTLKLRWLRKGLPAVTAQDGRVPGGAGKDHDDDDDEEPMDDEDESMEEQAAMGEIGKKSAQPAKSTRDKEAEMGIPALDEEQEYEWKWKPKMEVSRRTFFL